MTQINKYNKKEQKDIEKGCCGIPGIPNSRFLKAVSDSTRLRILAYLAEVNEPQIVNEIAQHFPIDVSVVSRHLAILRNEGILLAEKQGKEVYYSVRYEFLSSIFRGFANAIESCCPSKEEVES
jgi:DNA-binding transcriptional ArsR family regulator